MPMYVFSCSKCNSKFDSFASIEHRDKTKICPNCTGPASRDLMATLKTSVKDGDHERWSWSMGCTPEQAKEVLKVNPEVEFRHGADGGPMLIKNRQHKLEMMKLMGFQEY